MQKGLVPEDTSPSAFVARNPSATLLKNPGPSKLSWRRELNPRPSDYKSDALPTELRQPCSNRTKVSQRQSNCKQLSRPLQTHCQHSTYSPRLCLPDTLRRRRFRKIRILDRHIVLHFRELNRER